MTPTNISAAGLTLLKSFEGCVLTAMLPTPHDVPTLGWGLTHNADGSAIRIGQRCTQAEADAALAVEVGHVAAKVAALIAGIPTTQLQFDAMVVLAYNIGIRAFATSSLLRMHRAGDYDSADASFMMWRFQHGQVLPGLVRRRAAEAALYRHAA